MILLTACGGGGGASTAAAPAATGQATVTTPAEAAPGATTPEVAPPTTTTPTTPTNPDPGTQPQPQVPVAVLPSQVEALVKKTVRIDGSKSTGVNGSAVSYLWTLESKPAASTSQLLDLNLSGTTLWPDVVGTYKLKLVVSSGGKTSEPAYVTVEAIPMGTQPPFATFNASGFRTGAYVNSVSGCNYYRADQNFQNFQNFWDFRSTRFDLNCPYTIPGAPADVSFNGSFGGGQLNFLVENLINLQYSGVSGSTQVTWLDINNISGYGYSLSAEPTELTSIPQGKTTGTQFNHSMNPVYSTQYSSGTFQYQIAGTMTPTNMPGGWEVSQDIAVVIYLEGSTFENNQPGFFSTKVFEKTYTGDFSETVPLNLAWADMPVAFAVNSTAAYRAVFSHRMTLKRAAS